VGIKVKQPTRCYDLSEEVERVKEQLRREVESGFQGGGLKEDLGKQLKGLDDKQKELERMREFKIVGDFAGESSGKRRRSSEKMMRR